MNTQKPSNVSVLIGAQWGDEGKGKWIDVLARDAELVVRYQGGNNAGHTIYVEGTKFVLHQIPSGVFHERGHAALAAGVVVNPSQLVLEMDKIGAKVRLTPERLWLSGRAHVITPWHIHLDTQRESGSANPIGTTRRGIGPTYSEKAARTGLRLGHYVRRETRERWLARMAEASVEFREFHRDHPELWQEFAAAAERLAPFVCDAEARIRDMAMNGAKILIEGAQGTLLDLDHGTYPFVTSSSTGVGGVCQSIGLSPKLISRIIGIGKGYVTRVGEGPFPTELKDEIGALIARKGNEFGATTGRPRRTGWMDCVALRYVAVCNGLDGVVLNKIDILSGISELKIAVAYRHPELGTLTEFPWDTEVLAGCEPVYEKVPGWSEDVTGMRSWADLPAAARSYIETIERHSGVRVLMIGTGPGRDDVIFRN